ncbi:MAG: DUF2098 domain-containing protein [Methanomicrobiales archaeon]|nr:DUF2098 domain-containing protein [Methanomicrobiales archaeon]
MMESGEITVGMQVRYPRTGTVGKVVRLEKQERDLFAELDSTHLLYRIDQLVTYEGKGKAGPTAERGDLERLVEEREFARKLHTDTTHLDEMCDGGG